MLLTKPQQFRFWREWQLACKAQHWTTREGCSEMEIDAHRHELLSRAGFDSLTKVDRAAGFDRLLAELGQLRDNLARTAELTDAGRDLGLRRRYLHNIREFSHPLGGLPYALAIARSKFHLTAGLHTLDDLATEQLLHLMMTVESRHRARARAVSGTAGAPPALSGASPDSPRSPDLDLANCPF